MESTITGRDIWLLLDGKHSVEQIAGELAERKNIPNDQALQEVLDFITRLWNESLLVATEESDS